MSGIVQGLIASFKSAASAADEFFNRVTLLLNTGSTNGAQNNTFLDSSTNNFTITRNGNTTQGTFTPFSQTGWSNYFDGNANCDLTTPSNAAFGYGTGDFSLEAFVYQQTNANARIIDHGDNNFNFGLSSSGVVTLFSSATNYSTATSLVPLNTWTHICVTRQSSALRIFVNGILRYYNASFTNSKGTSTVNIGSNPGAGGETLNGYISNLRIVNGGVPSAYSTSSTTTGTTIFTPSTTPLSTSESLTAGSLSLLTCQDNRFKDNSANAFALTVNGTPSVQAFEPFAPGVEYSTSVVGGSGYFDGTGDYLKTPSSASFTFGTGDFTAEAWVYPTVLSSNRVIFDFRAINDTSGYQLGLNSTTTPYVANSGGGILNGTATLIANSWIHFAVTRSSGTLRIFINGVQAGSVANSLNCTNTVCNIGGNYSGGEAFSGYISNARVVKGTAVYTATFTPPTALLTDISGTSLLLNATNSGIFDSTAKNVLETVGNAQVSTTQAKWGTTSMAFDGTGDYLSIPYSVTGDLGGTTQLTIEFWVYMNSLAARGTVAARNNGSTAAGSQFDLNIETTGQINIAFYTGSTTITINSATAIITTGSWIHVALSKDGSGNYKIFVNGTQSGTTVTNTSSINSPTIPMTIGAQNTSGSVSLNGYIDDLRITRGLARYTANFTAPTAAFPLQ
jgi:hypothetical protein